MNTLGIDFGCLNIKSVVLGDNAVLGYNISQSGEDMNESAKTSINQALAESKISDTDLPIVITGVSGKSSVIPGQSKSVSTCLARGVHFLFPSARMAIEMGAESTTVIKINERGRLSDWANHDKCAAGTGLFLQQMAKLMEMPLEEMAALSFQANSKAEVTSTCAVFAESEVISHVHRLPPTPKPDIAAGIFYSVVSRVISLCKRIGIEKEIAVTGGVALNKGLINILEKELSVKVLIPENPQIVAAIGAAVIARENAEKGIK